ncbi:MAG: hypothetical protein RLZZ341_686, partial [Pseudomonadota bacterium]
NTACCVGFTATRAGGWTTASPASAVIGAFL